MPVAVACPKCKKKYNLPENMLGKPVKCTSCQATFKTPATVGGAAGRAQTKVDPRQQAAARKRQLEMQQKAKELKQLGVDGPLQRAPDVFDGLGQMRGTPDPLGNHMIDDPGFGEVKYTASGEVEVEDDDPMAAMFDNPALQSPKKKRISKNGKRTKNGGTKWYMQPWALLTLVFAPMFVSVLVLILTNAISHETTIIISVGIFSLFNLATTAGYIWALILTYQATESILQTILAALFWPFIIYVIIVNWQTMRPCFHFACAVFFLIVLASGVFGAIAYTAQPIEDIAMMRP